MPTHLEVGRSGEALACDYLESRGYVILDRNWHCRSGEIDIIAMKTGILVIVEVKTRSGTGYGTPRQAITPAKAQRIHRLARLWLAAHRQLRYRKLRYDAISIVAAPGTDVRLEHVEGGF